MPPRATAVGHDSRAFLKHSRTDVAYPATPTTASCAGSAPHPTTSCVARSAHRTPSRRCSRCATPHRRVRSGALARQRTAASVDPDRVRPRTRHLPDQVAALRDSHPRRGKGYGAWRWPAGPHRLPVQPAPGTGARGLRGRRSGAVPAPHDRLYIGEPTFSAQRSSGIVSIPEEIRERADSGSSPSGEHVMKKQQRTSKTKALSAAALDAMHDDGVDLSSRMDLTKAVRPGTPEAIPAAPAATSPLSSSAART